MTCRNLHAYLCKCWVFDGSEVKASARNAGDPSSIPGSGRSPREGNGNPLHPPRKSLVGYSPWSPKELDSAKLLTLSDIWHSMIEYLMRTQNYAAEGRLGLCDHRSTKITSCLQEDRLAMETVQSGRYSQYRTSRQTSKRSYFCKQNPLEFSGNQ